MKAFIGLFMCSFLSFPGELLEGEVEELEAPEDWGDIWVMADMAPREEDMPEKLEADMVPRPAADMLDMLCMADIDMLGTLVNMLEADPSTVILCRLSLRSLTTGGSLNTMADCGPDCVQSVQQLNNN